MADFAARLLAWFDEHGRKDLPWQVQDPYRVWVSEIMLQQTQVATVIPYYTRFIARFPVLAALADAPVDEVLALWSGLGYYARARNLHRAARLIRDAHGGEFPRDIDAVRRLPGVGRSTAAAILAQAFGERHAILDGNARRVLARYEAIGGWPGRVAVASELWSAAERYTPATRVADYTQAIMDLGATLCTRSKPRCLSCPVAGGCIAHGQGNETAYPGRKTREKQATPRNDHGAGSCRRRRVSRTAAGGRHLGRPVEPARDRRAPRRCMVRRAHARARAGHALLAGAAARVQPL